MSDVSFDWNAIEEYPDNTESKTERVGRKPNPRLADKSKLKPSEWHTRLDSDGMPRFWDTHISDPSK